MTIHALPESTVRAIGATLVISDPATLVKELLDNALDAQAASVFIEVSTNVLDTIQIRDDGHGIAPADRKLLGRRYCTSKIKTEHELANIGGSSLGFRGEALFSAAQLCRSTTITTRVEGESAGMQLTITKDGLCSPGRKISHAVGTTVRLTDFLFEQPVRKQVMARNTASHVASIKRLLQAYAFARPAVRLNLRILKSANGKDNLSFAGRSSDTLLDTAMKITGTPCVSQCRMQTLVTDAMHIESLLPVTGGDPTKLSGHGQFISVDGRPLSTTRNLAKQIVKVLKATLKGDTPSSDTCKDPFLVLKLVCRSALYDANVEPAKDDVLFADLDQVLEAVRRLPENDDQECNSQVVHGSDAQPIRPSFSPKERLDSRSEMETSHTPVNRLLRLETLLNDSPCDLRPERGSLSPIALTRSSVVEEDDEESDEEDEGDFNTANISNPWILAKINSLRKEPYSTANPPHTDMEARPRPCPSGPATYGSDIARTGPSLPTPAASSPVKAGIQADEATQPLKAANQRVPAEFTRTTNATTMASLVPAVDLDQHLHDYYRPPNGITDPSNGPPSESNGTTLGLVTSSSPGLSRVTKLGHQASKQRAFVPQRPRERDPERDAWFDIPKVRTQEARSREHQGPARVLIKSSSYEMDGQGDDILPGRPLQRPNNNKDIRAFLHGGHRASSVSIVAAHGQEMAPSRLTLRKHRGQDEALIVDEHDADVDEIVDQADYDEAFRLRRQVATRQPGGSAADSRGRQSPGAGLSRDISRWAPDVTQVQSGNPTKSSDIVPSSSGIVWLRVTTSTIIARLGRPSSVFDHREHSYGWRMSVEDVFRGFEDRVASDNVESWIEILLAKMSMAYPAPRDRQDLKLRLEHSLRSNAHESIA